MQKAYLILENGRVFSGSRFGAFGDVTGELVFTTAMTGYLETISDPSFSGQIVMQTFPLIGNYGVIPSDFESRTPLLFAYVVREWCEAPSNFRSQGNLDAFLKEKGIVGLSGVDTRCITRIIREQGVMNAAIVSEYPADLAAFAAGLKQYKVVGAVEAATCKDITVDESPEDTRRVVLWDFGAKQNIQRELKKRGCTVIRVPAHTPAETILSYKPNGLMLSNGPGDPKENLAIVEELKKVMATGMPMFGICLGHQLLALSAGADTAKLKYGHRGANQPVKEVRRGRVFMSSQNHGYAVVNDSLPQGAAVSFVNANDNTCEGVDYAHIPAFSVQFHPEAAAGPRDTSYLFDRFMQLIDDNPVEV